MPASGQRYPAEHDLIVPRENRAPAESGSAGDWRHGAICVTEDPELFFPVGTDGPALLQIAEAKSVCRRCPVTEACLAWALEFGQDAGVWGGLSENERRGLRLRGAGSQAGAEAGAA